ncbi:MAG: hypothetical protein JNM30_03595 [Rhodospirillales bacterium]|nr:hypothetical protein [Rhodospirillales bacterium]
METLRKVVGATLSMLMVATAAMAAGAAMMFVALFLVGLVDWTGGQQIAVVDSRGVADQGPGEQREAPRPFN